MYGHGGPGGRFRWRLPSRDWSSATLSCQPNFGVGQSASSKLDYLLEEVREYHAVFARETEHVVEVPASRRDHIEAWLGNRVHYPFTVPDLTSRGLTFLGARMIAIGGGVVAQLMYVDRDGEHIAICVAFTEDKLDAPLQSIQKAGLKVMGLAEGHHVFIVAGPKFNPELEPIAKSLPALLQGPIRRHQQGPGEAQLWWLRSARLNTAGAPRPSAGRHATLICQPPQREARPDWGPGGRSNLLGRHTLGNRAWLGGCLSPVTLCSPKYS